MYIRYKETKNKGIQAYYKTKSSNPKGSNIEKEKWTANNYKTTKTLVIKQQYFMCTVHCVCACLCAQLCQIFFNLMEFIPPGSSVHGIFQARILEQVVMSYSRGSSQPSNLTHISCISCMGRQIVYHRVTQYLHTCEQLHVYGLNAVIERYNMTD